MAARFKTKKHTLDGTWEQLSDIFTGGGEAYVSSLTMRCDPTNTTLMSVAVSTSFV